MPRRAAGLPDALVGLAPRVHRALGLALDDRPQPAREPLAAAGVEQDAVQDGAVDVVLALVEGAVADPDRARAGVAREVVARGLGEVAAAVDPVHDLHRAVGVGLEVGDVLHELLGLPVEVEPVQRLQREGGVAHPGVPVVPVALAAGRLGQRRGRGGDGRAGRHVRQALDGEDRARDRLAELRDPASGRRSPTSASSAWWRPSASAPRRRSPARRAPPAHDRAQYARSRGVQGVAGAHAAALDPHRHVGRQPQRHARAGRVGAVAVVLGAPTRPRCGRSRTPARTRARPRPCPRCTRRCGRACGRRRRRPAGACAG